MFIKAAQNGQMCVFFPVKDLNILSRPSGSDGPREYPRKPTLNEEMENRSSPAPGSGSPRLTPQDQGGNNNILIYVSVLAAVVLGLLLYVAYKWWGHAAI